MPVALGIVAACLVLLRQTEFGPGLTPDSATYISAARKLHAGDGSVPLYGGYAYWPPLFPLLLAIAGIFHDDMIAAAAVVNAVAFGLTVFAAAAWLRRYVSPLLVAWAGLALALSPAAGVASYVWSESVFVLLVVAALSTLDRFLATGAPKALLVCAGFAALCCLTRYAGASVVVCGIALIVRATTLAPRRRIRAAALYAAVGLAPTALWMVRNLLVLGSPMGDRSQYDEQFSAPDTVRMMVEATLHGAVGPKVLDWIDLFAPADGSTAYLLAWLLAVWGLVGCALARWHRAGLWPGVAVAGGFALCYLAFMAVASPLGGLNAEPRFAVPLNAPMLVVLALAFHACGARVWSAAAGWGGEWAAWRRWLVRSAMVAALSLWLAQWVAPNVAELKQWRKHGSDGYGARRWVESETLAHLESTAFEGRLLSNDPFAVYLLTGGGSAARRSGNYRIERVRKNIPHRTDVVWFYAPRVPRSTDLMALLADSPKMKLIATHADGAIFNKASRQRPKGGPARERKAPDAATQLAAALLRRAREGKLVATSYFNVYLHDSEKRLTYVRRGCASADVGPWFFLHVTPKDPAERHLGQWYGRWRPVSVGFHNLDFRFAPRGVRVDGLCVATAALPSFDIAQVRTGQWSAGPLGTIWSAAFAVPPTTSH